MHSKLLTGFSALLGTATLSMAMAGCSASSQGLSSTGFDSRPKTPPTVATAPIFNLDLSVDAAYAAIPHKRTAMDFVSSNMPAQDKRFLEVALHVVDQGIRLRVSTYQKFSRSELKDSQSLTDMKRLIDYLESTEAPSSLSAYQAQLLRALADQRAFFDEWQSQGTEFQYGTHQTLGTHPKVQSASTALKEAYGILMETYPSEGSSNQQAFFDYHCALDFL